MDNDEIRNALITTLEEIQINSGRVLPEINDLTRPLEDLPGFDSINAVEASILLSEHLGCEVAPDIAIFARFGRPLTIAEIINQLFDLIK